MAMLYNPSRENTVKKATMAAADDAQKFMGRLFSGQKAARCECGREVAYRDGKIICEDCGRNLDAAGYVQRYDGLFIKTTIDVAKKRFRLSVSTENDFDE